MPSNRTSRQVSQKQAQQGAVPARIGLREWLAQLTRPPRLVAAASFDTRFRKPAWLTGSAARGAARRLRQRGLVVVTPAESFFVDTTTGPLCAGEADRARRWGAALGKTVALSGPAPAGSPRTRVPQGPSASRA